MVKIFKSSSKLIDFQPLLAPQTELETPFQLLKSQKTLNYWACIQCLNCLFRFWNHHSFSLKDFEAIFWFYNGCVLRELEGVTSSREWTAAGKRGEKNSLQLDLDLTSFTSHRHTHRNVGNIFGFQLMALFQMYSDSYSAVLILSLHSGGEQTVPVLSLALAPSFFILQK